MENSDVPGCNGGSSMPKWDFCYRHYDTFGPLVLVAETPPAADLLGVCEGDCGK
jgi:hypothetical protein